MDDGLVRMAEAAPFSTPGNIRRYPKEKILFRMLLVCAVLFWSAVILKTWGVICVVLLLLYLFGLAAHSHLISHLQGNGVKIDAGQFPRLHARLMACCEAVGLQWQPDFYMMAGNGVLNAFVTRFLRRYYVVLLSDVVDALQEDEDALNFYIGHELGHIAQKHLARHWWISTMMLIPLLGTAYSRAKEYSCDQYGLACCRDSRSAIHALVVLAAGSKHWKTMNVDAYIAQSERSGDFWMSVNELCGDYPWLSKRVARVRSGDAAVFPRRHPLAWIVAALVPRTGFGLIGGVMLYGYIALVLLSMAMPFYDQMRGRSPAAAVTDPRIVKARQEERLRLDIAHAYAEGMAVADSIDSFIASKKRRPASVAETGYKPDPKRVQSVEITSASGKLTVRPAAPNGWLELQLMPVNVEGKMRWICEVDRDIDANLIPSDCEGSHPLRRNSHVAPSAASNDVQR